MYSAQIDSEYGHAHGILILYSVTSRESFEEAKTYRERLERPRDGYPYPAILVANKCDLKDREITTEGWLF